MTHKKTGADGAGFFMGNLCSYLISQKIPTDFWLLPR